MNFLKPKGDFRIKRNQLKLDIHGLNEVDAYSEILQALNNSKLNIKSILVIHGFHGGNILKNMVRSFNHYKIDYILPSFANDGETTIFLK